MERAWIVQEGADRARLTYFNDVDHNSKAGTWTLQVGSIIVDLKIKPTSGMEIATPVPRGGYVSYPPQEMVADGEGQEFLIIYPMN